MPITAVARKGVERDVRVFRVAHTAKKSQRQTPHESSELCRELTPVVNGTPH